MLDIVLLTLGFAVRTKFAARLKIRPPLAAQDMAIVNCIWEIEPW
jgi:hypothetical protein